MTIDNILYRQHQEMKRIEQSLELTSLQLKIYKYLITDGPCTRGQICEAFGFEIIEYDYIQYNTRKVIISNKGYPRHIKQYKNWTTIYDNLTILLKKGLVEKYQINNHKRGRQNIFWRIINNDRK